MPLEVILDSLDTVDESERQFFVETEDGKHKLDWAKRDEFVKQPLVAKNKDFQKRLEKVKPIAEKFKDVQDDDWDAYQQWKTERAEGGDKDGKAGTPAELQAKWQADREASEKKLKTVHAKEIADRDSKIKGLEDSLKRNTVSAEVAKWASKYNADPEAYEELLTAALKRFTLDEKGRVIVIDDDGDPLDVKPETYFAETFKTAKKFYFLATETGGSGPNGNGKSTAYKTDWRKLPPSERAKVGRK